MLLANWMFALSVVFGGDDEAGVCGDTTGCYFVHMVEWRFPDAVPVNHDFLLVSDMLGKANVLDC